MRKMLQMFLKVVEFLALVLILLAAVTYIYGIKPVVILSGSMEPVMKTGSVAFVNQKTEYQDIVVGDIIQYKTETGVSCTHRAIKITEEGIETKGDNNDNSDGITTIEENFMGKVLFSIPKLGVVIKEFQTPKGIFSMVLFIAGIALLSYVAYSGEDDKNSEKNENRNNQPVNRKQKKMKEYDTL